MVDCYFNYHRRRRGPRAKKLPPAENAPVGSASDDQQTITLPEPPVQIIDLPPRAKSIMSFLSMESLMAGLSKILGGGTSKSYALAK